ncbi:hypothetical protein DSM3645_00095 [Blastopirellula marina DSM 3645]|uniref:Uncharacterized protein n=2 Tax=Blastopirellula marina TaxID=124 RepID=A3ZM98_9BACT|nr:hypothetical protein DSM3645_00095 [Blastopirellula marina DSM 3645]
MMRIRPLALLFLTGGLTVVTTGCLSLSLGGKTCTGTSPETQSRLTALEQRVSQLEQMLPPPIEVYSPAASP